MTRLQDILKQIQELSAEAVILAAPAPVAPLPDPVVVKPHLDIKFTKDKFMSFYGVNLDPQLCYDAIVAALSSDGILTDMTLIGALATVRVEVGRNFRPVEERSQDGRPAGTAYEGRASLGNTQPGDGPKYKGRGYIQLTGRSNYTNYSKVFNVDLVNHPELALSVDLSAKVLSRYFKDRKVNVACDRQDWVEVRRLVNGGANGLADFQSIISQYLSKIN